MRYDNSYSKFAEVFYKKLDSQDNQQYLDKTQQAITTGDFILDIVDSLGTDCYSIGYEDGKSGRSIDIDRADDQEYYLGFQDGKGDRERELVEIEVKKDGNPTGDPYIAEIHTTIDNIFKKMGLS